MNVTISDGTSSKWDQPYALGTDKILKKVRKEASGKIKKNI